MGVYGAIYQLDFEQLENVCIPRMKKGDFSERDFQGWYSDPFREDRQVLINNPQYLDDSFQHIKPEMIKHEDPRKNKYMVPFYEQYALFFEKQVYRTCIIDDPDFYISKWYLTSLFEDKSIDFLYRQRHSVAFDILKKLDGPCFWTRSSGGYFEGIRSWITPAEVELLLVDLPSLEERKGDPEKMDRFKEFLESTVERKYGLLNGGDLSSN